MQEGQVHVRRSLRTSASIWSQHPRVVCAQVTSWAIMSSISSRGAHPLAPWWTSKPNAVCWNKESEKENYPKSAIYHGPLWPPLLRLVVQPSTSPPLVVRVILVDVASVSHSFTSCTHPPLDSFGSSQYQQTFCRKLPNPYMQLAPMYLCISRVLQSNCLLDPTCHQTCVWSHTWIARASSGRYVCYGGINII